MLYFLVLTAVLLSAALFLSIVKRGRFAVPAKIGRLFIVILSLIFFTVLFIQKSAEQFEENKMTIQVVNKLPQPLDFYIIKKENSGENVTYQTKHIGSIRANHFRLAYEDMEGSDELWLAGIAKNGKLQYFTQHSIPNKNMDQTLEVRSYLNQSLKLSEIAKAEVAVFKVNNITEGIWYTLDMLLLFLNVTLLLKREKKAVIG